MNNCPVCSNQTKDKRCVTPACSAYSQKVIESEIPESLKRRLLELADREDCGLIPASLGCEILEALWNGSPISCGQPKTEDGLTLQKIDVWDSEVKTYDGWGSCEASGSVTINGFEFQVSFEGNNDMSEFSLEMEADEYERLLSA